MHINNTGTGSEVGARLLGLWVIAVLGGGEGGPDPTTVTRTDSVKRQLPIHWCTGGGLSNDRRGICRIKCPIAMNRIICMEAPFLRKAFMHSMSKVVVLDVAALDIVDLGDLCHMTN